MAEFKVLNWGVVETSELMLVACSSLRLLEAEASPVGAQRQRRSRKYEKVRPFSPGHTVDQGHCHTVHS